MLLEVLNGRSDHLERDELVSSLLEAGDDLTNETTVDTVRPGEQCVRARLSKAQSGALT